MTTFINTAECQRVDLGDLKGEVSEIVNKQLCGAEDVVAMLRWLREGQRFEAESMKDTHQLVYLMEGDGVINLDGKDYEVNEGAGIFLNPAETASVSQSGDGTLKLLHLVVPKIEGR